MSALDQGYAVSLQQYAGGHPAYRTEQTRDRPLYRFFQRQTEILAYMDVFAFRGILAFCAVPLAL
jgi:hypothetical protein